MFSGEGSFPPSTDDSNPEALRELRYSFGGRPELPTSAPIVRKGSCSLQVEPNYGVFL
jgi:hypothetical protein